MLKQSPMHTASSLSPSVVRFSPMAPHGNSITGSCSRQELAEEILRLAGLQRTPVQPATQAEFGAPYRKPVNSTLANISAARLGIELRPWQEALEVALRESAAFLRAHVTAAESNKEAMARA